MIVGNERATTDVTSDLTLDLEWQHRLTNYASWHPEAFGEDSFRWQLRAGGCAAVFDRLYDEAANGVLARQFAGAWSSHTDWLTNLGWFVYKGGRRKRLRRQIAH